MLNKNHPLFYPQLITVIALITYLVVAVFMFLLLPVFSLGNDILFGWILGALINLLNYFLIFVQARRLQLKVTNNLNPSTRSGYMFLRMALSTVGFVIAVLVEDSSGNPIFNLFSVFAAYLVISVVIFITGASLKVKKSS
jgi:hypothetical protein